MAINTPFVSSTQVASSVPFDNATNGFTSSDVQSAIVEAENNPKIPELTADPVSPVPGQTWVLAGQIGTPVGLLLAITTGAISYRLSYYTSEGTIVRTVLT